MLLHKIKNGRPKVWCKLVGVSTSCLFLLILSFHPPCCLLARFPSLQLKLHEVVFVVFQWVISRLWKPLALFLGFAFPSPLKVVLVPKLQLLIFILYPFFETCNLSFFVACHYLPYSIFKTRMQTWIWKKKHYLQAKLNISMLMCERKYKK